MWVLRLPLGSILMVMAGDAESDIVQALGAGADDCISGPFRMGELVARCRAVLRRISGKDAAGQTTLKAGELELDLNRLWGSVFWTMSDAHSSEVHLRMTNLTKYIESLQEKVTKT